MSDTLSLQYNETFDDDFMQKISSCLEIDIEENDNFTITIVGDLHLNSATPKTRIDDYPNTVVEKLESLRLFMEKEKSTLLILLGDVFHKPSQPVSFLLKVMEEFKKFKESGITVTTIIGNHDITWDRLDTLSRSSLGVLFSADIIKHYRQIDIKIGEANYHFDNYDYSEPLHEVDDYNKFNMMCAHMFYDYNFPDDSVVSKEDLNRYGYKAYFLGHDHVPYENSTVKTDDGNTIIVRSGSFTRGTTHSYNLGRKIYVTKVVLNNKGKASFTKCPIKCKPADVIFRSDVLDKVSDEALMSKMDSKFTELVNNLYSNDDTFLNVFDILDTLDIEKDVKDTIEFYLTNDGIFRKRK